MASVFADIAPTFDIVYHLGPANTFLPPVSDPSTPLSDIVTATFPVPHHKNVPHTPTRVQPTKCVADLFLAATDRVKFNRKVEHYYGRLASRDPHEYHSIGNNYKRCTFINSKTFRK